MQRAKFHFDHHGIGKLIQGERLVVPANQRSYAWKDEHVSDLFHDLSNAIRDDEVDYFLGTVVLTEGQNGVFEVADGQQRLATISILLSAIRDKFLELGRHERAGDITASYLSQLAEHSDDRLPKLTLNVDDNGFFMNQIIAPPSERPQELPYKMKRSNELLRDATKAAREHVERVISPYKDNDQPAALLKWVNYIREQATVVIVRVPTHIDAYRMFETLNDRGAKASQADLLKNYFFSKAENRTNEVQTKWSAISGAIESIGEDGDLVTYIRHYWITQHGPTREKDLAHDIRSKITSETRTVEFLTALEDSAPHYVGLFNPEHRKWNGYRNACRQYVKVMLNDLRVEQIRPLLFAVSRYFSPEEATKAFKLFISWSVRFLVVGGRGGFLDRHYSLRAQEVGTGKITTAKGLVEVMRDYVPPDSVFEEEFSRARVSKGWLARYYLRALDLAMKGEGEPEVLANEDQQVLNVEHILPRTPSDAWDVDEDTAQACQNRLGNLVLLQATKNVALGNSGFPEKKNIYANSVINITSEVAAYDRWTVDEINERQARMAKLAIKTWPSLVGS